jgi:GMP synthase-like glutamine amidotransferase
VSPRLAVLHHLERPFTGYAAEPFAEAGLELVERDLRHGDPLPSLDEIDGVLAFGGEQSVREIDRYPYLVEEVDLLREAVAREMPVLGVCLGGQLLAHALGGEVTKMPRRMVEWAQVRRLPAGDDDPVAGGLPSPFAALHWNEDSFTVPPGAVELLERAGPGGEAFRHGASAWGVQFHCEADPVAVEEWYERFPLDGTGITEEQARAADERHMEAQREVARTLFGGFARVVVSRTAATRR